MELTLTVSLTSAVAGQYNDYVIVTHDGPPPTSQAALVVTVL